MEKKQLNTRVDQELKDMVISEAKEQGVTAGDVVEAALEFYFAGGTLPQPEPRGTGKQRTTTSFALDPEVQRKVNRRIESLANATGRYLSMSVYLRWLVGKDLTRFNMQEG